MLLYRYCNTSSLEVIVGTLAVGKQLGIQEFVAESWAGMMLGVAVLTNIWVNDTRGLCEHRGLTYFLGYFCDWRHLSS